MQLIGWRGARLLGACAVLGCALVALLPGADAWPDVVPVAPAAPGDPSVVPAVASHVSCPDEWLGFENPQAAYRLCYPRSWGFTDFTAADRLDAIPARALRNLHLVNEAAFPWVIGTRSFDAIRRGIIDVEINALRAGVGTEDECAPGPIGDAGLLACEQHYDVLGLPADDGPVRALKIDVPGVSTPGARLLVIVRTAATVKEVDIAWQLVRSIRPV